MKEISRLDIHLVSPRVKVGKEIDIRSGNVWGLIDGIKYRDGFSYRLVRDRRGCKEPNESRWMIAEAEGWSPEHLRLVKDLIIENNGSFELSGGFFNKEQTVLVNLYCQAELKLTVTKKVNRPGLYLYRGVSAKPFELKDRYTDLVVLTG